MIWIVTGVGVVSADFLFAVYVVAHWTEWIHDSGRTSVIQSEEKQCT